MVEQLGARPVCEDGIDLATGQPHAIREVVERRLARTLTVRVHLERDGVPSAVTRRDREAKHLAMTDFSMRLAS